MHSPVIATLPWYRQGWPWLLIAGPAIVVVASFVSAWLAVTTDDGVIADDYYKRGLLINRELERSRRAEAMGLAAQLQIAAGGAVRLEFEGPIATDALPGAVTLALIHPTRAGLDRRVVLTRGPRGVYIGTIELPPSARWLVSVETPDWRIPAVETSSGLANVTLSARRADR